jgi:hypothetical protein
LRAPREKVVPKKPRGRVWPGLKSVGGDIQPLSVTVLTPATSRRCFHSTNNLKFVNARKLARAVSAAGREFYRKNSVVAGWISDKLKSGNDVSNVAALA